MSRRLVFLLVALAAFGGTAAAVSAAPTDLITLQNRETVGVERTPLGATNYDGRAVLTVRGCHGAPVPGLLFVSFDASTAALGTVPAPGSPVQAIEIFPDGASEPAFPDFASLSKPDQTLPTIDGPAQQLQAQIPVAGGAAVQFAGFNAPFLGNSAPFAGAVTVDQNGSLVTNGFEVTLSQIRVEIQILAPGTQPQQFVQPFSFLCRKVERTASLLTKTGRDFPGIGSPVGSILPAAVEAAFKDRLRKEEKIVREATTHIKADEYKPVLELAAPLKKAQKSLDGAIAKVLPQIRSAARRQALLKARNREDADAAATVAAMKQIITPAG
jgi:hypothetical protein